jgi:hypothetical protein
MNKEEQQIVFIYTVNGGEPRRLYLTRADVDEIHKQGWVTAEEENWDGNGKWFSLPKSLSLVAFNILEGRIMAGYRTLLADMKEGAA